jgi:hypothetical protein
MRYKWPFWTLVCHGLSLSRQPERSSPLRLVLALQRKRHRRLANQFHSTKKLWRIILPKICLLHGLCFSTAETCAKSRIADGNQPNNCEERGKTPNDANFGIGALSRQAFDKMRVDNTRSNRQGD